MSVLMALPVCASSLLEPVSFPKTFSDVPFNDRWAVIAEGYTKFDRVYDQDGNCISGCPYPGITITQDKQDVEEATDYFASLVDEILDAEEQDGTNDGDQGTVAGTSRDDVGTILTSSVTRNSVPLRSPVNNNSVLITSDFSFRATKGLEGFHGGVDIGVDYGTPVVATADGVVTVADKEHEYNGPYIQIQHSNGFYSWYLHLSKISVSPGQSVKMGQVIGQSGAQGARSTGSHLDYRISLKRNGKDLWVDVLCPCRATNKVAKQESQSKNKQYNEDVGEYGKDSAAYKCRHSAFWRDNYYSFYGDAKAKGAPWRIASGHCMKTSTDKLPDEK